MFVLYRKQNQALENHDDIANLELQIIFMFWSKASNDIGYISFGNIFIHNLLLNNMELLCNLDDEITPIPSVY